jgi:hypothetical protein
MKNNFTTPAFAKMLKEHGIEIDTPFFHAAAQVSKTIYIGTKTDNKFRIDAFYPKVEKGVIVNPNLSLPAYPLTEVLGWLPETIICEGKFYQIDFDTVNLTVGYARAKLLEMVWAIEPKNISDIITQGLTEGWLTKETIFNAIKDNAK